MFRLYCLIGGYFIGCLQFSYIIGKLFYKIDIREHGSGNAGSTNAIRTMGAGVGLVVFTLDLFKSIGAYMLAAYIFGGHSIMTDIEGLSVLPGLYASFGVILGHDFPFYLRFKGGKGMAATCGAIMFMDAWLAWPAYGVAVGLIAITRRVSIGTLAFTAIIPALIAAFGYGLEAAAVATAFGALCWYQHIPNIKRLKAGCEPKLSFGRGKTGG